MCIQIEHLKKICGAKMTPANELEPSIERVTHKHKKLVLPKEFDARKHWGHCSTIGAILGVFRCFASFYSKLLFCKFFGYRVQFGFLGFAVKR